MSFTFYDTVTCDPVDQFQTFTIGNTNECHNTSQQFNALLEFNIAQSFFGRGLHLFVYRDPNCQGINANVALTNGASGTGQCQVLEGLSFQVQ
jgi:hypothetical protein